MLRGMRQAMLETMFWGSFRATFKTMFWRMSKAMFWSMFWGTFEAKFKTTFKTMVWGMFKARDNSSTAARAEIPSDRGTAQVFRRQDVQAFIS